MTPEEVQAVVRATLLVMGRIARTTRTKADEMLVSIVQANEPRIAEAVAELCQGDCPAPTDAQVTEALRRVGIKV